MNKYIVPTLALASFLAATATPALANESLSPSGTPNLRREFRQEVKEIRKDTRQEIASRSQELQAKLKEKRELERRSRITKFWKKTGERLQKLINREKKMADKIAARLQKFKDAGKNVSTQETMLADARLKIATAQTALDNAIVELKKMVDDGKPVADIIAKARELHKGVVAAIRTAHKALIDVIVSTRGMSVTPTPTPSPSATPTP